MTTLAEDLMLLLLNDRTGRPLVDSTHLPRALAGAVLIDLMERGAIQVTSVGRRGRRSEVTPLAPVSDDPILTRASKAIGVGRSIDTRKAVEKLQRRLPPRVLESLEQRCLVRREDDPIFGFIPRTRWWPTSRREELRLRLRSVLTEPATDPDVSSAALIRMLAATNALHKVFPELDRRSLRLRAKELAAGDWASKAVKDALDAVDATMIAVIAATSAAGGGSE